MVARCTALIQHALESPDPGASENLNTYKSSSKWSKFDVLPTDETAKNKNFQRTSNHLSATRLRTSDSQNVSTKCLSKDGTEFRF